MHALENSAKQAAAARSEKWPNAIPGIYRIESADFLNICDRVRTVWERSRELSADAVAAERAGYRAERWLFWRLLNGSGDEAPRSMSKLTGEIIAEIVAGVMGM